ncbi:CACTA en-spm transposon protein [Cucumis melo var. makuwa]|uniref:CACTA en-spm transposon protein n=1 Tax=Cucumis melo var. makuwa TaxID=1194695 RepID=A0A5D3B9A1_CUCMM|nr:CACTA en-spm transposon protein [Cucumis melo var. makuwa]
METDDIFLEFEDDLDNIAGGSSSVGNNTERQVAINRYIPMTIAPGAKKPISPHAIRFSQAIGVCVRKIFPVRCLKWADVGREYIEVVKGDLQRLFVLDFNDQAMNKFVEHQMLTTFKELRADCDKHFKKYSDPEEARANPPNALYELAERKGKLVDRVELIRKTHVRAGTFVSQAAEDAHNQMLELQFQPTPEGSQPLSKDEICDQVLGRQPGYSKGLGWGPKPKARRMARHLVRSPQKKRLNYKLNFMKFWKGLKYKIEITKC